MEKSQNLEAKKISSPVINVSVNSNWVHLPGQPPGISSKNFPGGSGFDLNCVKNEIETSKNSVNQIFTGENKKKPKQTSRIFDLFRGLRVFSMEFLLVNGSIFSHIPYKKSEELPLACLFEVFIGLWLSTPTFCIKKS